MGIQGISMYLVSIEDSIKDILKTPLGSRVMRPDYGSRIFELVDKKIDDEFKAKLAWYVVEAVSLWEKRVVIDEVKIVDNKNHKLKIRITFTNHKDIEVQI